eukprot:3726901-Amphidinium_carterae.1
MPMLSCWQSYESMRNNQADKLAAILTTLLAVIVDSLRLLRKLLRGVPSNSKLVPHANFHHKFNGFGRDERAQAKSWLNEFQRSATNSKDMRRMRPPMPKLKRKPTSIKDECGDQLLKQSANMRASTGETTE